MSKKIKIISIIIVSCIVLYLAVWSALVFYMMYPMYKKMGRSFAEYLVEYDAVLHKGHYGYSINI